LRWKCNKPLEFRYFCEGSAPEMDPLLQRAAAVLHKRAVAAGPFDARCADVEVQITAPAAPTGSRLAAPKIQAKSGCSARPIGAGSYILRSEMV
jgi:hypothetical protein